MDSETSNDSLSERGEEMKSLTDAPDKEKSFDESEYAKPNVKTAVSSAFTAIDASLEGLREIYIRRELLLQDMFRLYQDENLPNTRLKVIFVGEDGDDFGGLTNDLFTAFWKKAYCEFFVGENVVVPSVPIHKHKEAKRKFPILGRILSHTVASTKTLPTRLSKTTLLSIVLGDDIDDETILDDFLLFVTMPERLLLKKAISSFHSLSSREMDDLTEFYCVYGMHQLPTEEKLESQIQAIARNELLVKPHYMVSLLREGIPNCHMDRYWSKLTADAITFIMTEQIPTTATVLDCISFDGDAVRPEEERVLYFLKDYIKHLDQVELETFLYFVTGSTVQPTNRAGIKVSFTRLCGTERRPIAHTCGYLLELSVAYQSVQEFRQEMRAFMTSDHTFAMTIN